MVGDGSPLEVPAHDHPACGPHREEEAKFLTSLTASSHESLTVMARQVLPRRCPGASERSDRDFSRLLDVPSTFYLVSFPATPPVYCMEVDILDFEEKLRDVISWSHLTTMPDTRRI